MFLIIKEVRSLNSDRFISVKASIHWEWHIVCVQKLSLKWAVKTSWTLWCHKKTSSALMEPLPKLEDLVSLSVYFKPTVSLSCFCFSVWPQCMMVYIACVLVTISCTLLFVMHCGMLWVNVWIIHTIQKQPQRNKLHCQSMSPTIEERKLPPCCDITKFRKY